MTGDFEEFTQEACSKAFAWLNELCEEKDHRHIIYSATKGISALLIGLAIEDGLITDEDVRVLDLLPEYAQRIEHLDDRKRNLTLRDLLTMTDGFEWQDWPYGIREEGDFSRLLASSDGVRYILDKPMIHEPGTHYNYNSGASHLLSAIIQQATGRTALEYANERLFRPLGIQDAGWSLYQGVNNGASELILRPREMAKIGYLMLNKGRWGGEQILPAGWVEKSIQPLVRTDVEFIEEEYGYHWFTKSFGGRKVHSTEGLGGNFTFVVPDLNLVVVFSGGLVGREMASPYGYLENVVIPSVKSGDPLPPNPTLAQSLAQLGTSGEDSSPEVTAELPEIAKRMTGTSFVAKGGDNVLGIERMTFTFEKSSEGAVEIVYSGTGRDADWGLDIVFRRDELSEAQQSVRMGIGFDGHFRTIMVEHDEAGRVPFSAKGQWEVDGTLTLTVLSAWAIPETWTLTLDDDDGATLSIETPFLNTEVLLNRADAPGAPLQGAQNATE